ncbi:Hypothetical protein AA314_00254 [Archangium gephyra]|uniref:Uncharacterized protein n=1 Tax=Archangium gephyra TaxID=48 RepID=A0AAC8Q0A0_9BACT|nr:Hypothetical protein AA314_00254 [Archangium gephyra]
MSLPAGRSGQWGCGGSGFFQRHATARESVSIALPPDEEQPEQSSRQTRCVMDAGTTHCVM